MTLSVQARDRSGNVFARVHTSNAPEALRVALAWIRSNPGLVVEVVGADA